MKGIKFFIIIFLAAMFLAVAGSYLIIKIQNETSKRQEQPEEIIWEALLEGGGLIENT